MEYNISCRKILRVSMFYFFVFPFFFIFLDNFPRTITNGGKLRSKIRKIVCTILRVSCSFLIEMLYDI